MSNKRRRSVVAIPVLVVTGVLCLIFVLSSCCNLESTTGETDRRDIMFDSPRIPVDL